MDVGLIAPEALPALDLAPVGANQPCAHVDICSPEHELNSKVCISLKVSTTRFLKIFGGHILCCGLEERNRHLCPAKKKETCAQPARVPPCPDTRRWVSVTAKEGT